MKLKDHLKNTIGKVIKPVITSDLKPGMKIRFRKDLEDGCSYNNMTFRHEFFNNLDADYTIQSVDKEDDTILVDGFWVGVTAIDYAVCPEEQQEEQRTSYCLDDFKVGQEVKIRKDLKIEKRYGDDIVVDDMLEFCGKVVKVTQVNSIGFRIGGSSYNWTPEMVETIISQPQPTEKEPAKSTDNMRVIFNDRATILFKDGKKFVAKCEPDDEFDKEKGLYVCLAKSAGYKFKDIQKLLDNAYSKTPYKNTNPLTKEKLNFSNITVGSLVKVIHAGWCYPNYTTWFDKNDCTELKKFFKEGDSITPFYINDIFEVLAISYDKSVGEYICAINSVDKEKVFLIKLQGLKLFRERFSDKIKIGDIVEVINPLKCYSTYTRWFSFQDNRIAKLKSKFVYKENPCDGKYNGTKFKVVAKGFHENNTELQIYVIESYDHKRVYLMEGEALKLVEE